MSIAEESGKTASVTLATPPEWRVLNLERLEDGAGTREQIAMHLDERAERSEEFATSLADLVGSAADSGIVFGAICVPGEGKSIDFSTVTLALRSLAHGNGDEGERHNPANRTTGRKPGSEGDSPEIDADPGASQNAVMLPAGPAVRTESFEPMEIAPPLKAMPVFCVEYGLAVPNDERMAILTFTTIAPSDIDALRAQFAEIAETLAFS